MRPTWINICGGIALVVCSLLIGDPAGAQQCDTDFDAPHARIQLEFLSRINHPWPTPSAPPVCIKFSTSSVAYDPATHRLFVANPFQGLLEIYDLADPRKPSLFADPGNPVHLGGPHCIASNPVRCFRPNHVAVADGVVAVAVTNEIPTDPGRLVLMKTDGTDQRELVVGPSPTWVAFTPDRTKIVVANQGVPSADYSVDPEGSISIVEDWQSSAPHVVPVELQPFNSRKEELISRGVRIFGPCLSTSSCEVTVAQDLEPVALVISADSRKAWITFETNNVLGVLDIAGQRITDIRSFGLKDHSRWWNRLDASDDQEFDLRTWPLLGMYQPNGIDILTTHGRNYLITANRGNWREGSAFPDNTEKTTVADACHAGSLKPRLCDRLSGAPDISITRYPYRYTADENAPLPGAYSYGGRSFAIWTPEGRLVYDSGAALEAITHRACPSYFNSQSDQNTFDDRSDEKGPEPEGVAVADLAGRSFAFVSLRRIGGIVAFDVSEPSFPLFQQYINSRNFSVEPKDLPAGYPSEYFVNCAAGDLQGVKPVFVRGTDAPTGDPLLLLVNNYSGTVAIFKVRVRW